MRAYTLTHLSDADLLRELDALVSRDRATTATLLAHIAEVDARRLYLPAAYSSMHAYCVGELHLSEDAAYKRIQAARAARQFPILFTAVAEGRLHLAAVCLLAPHLTPESAEEMVEAATHRRKSEIEAWLAVRFPRADWPGMVGAGFLAPDTSGPQLAPGQVESVELAPAQVERGELAPGQVAAQPSAERFVLQLTIGKGTRGKLRYAQALLSHNVPSGDVGEVLDRALDALILQLEKRKFAATARPRRARPGSTVRPRAVPAQVRRAVWQRDEGRCTFASETGRRCAALRWIEFDHVDPVARGGRATVEGMRLRCRAHNQYEAERMFGVEFMRGKRDRSRCRAAEQRARKADPAPKHTGDVVAGLRALGLRADEARRASEHAATLGEVTLEKGLRAALQFVGRRTISRTGPGLQTRAAAWASP